MINLRMLRILSFVLVLAGVLFILNSSLNTLVGNLINGTALFTGSILGALFIIEGLALFLAVRKTKL